VTGGENGPGRGLGYRDAGVDIDRGNRLVERIKRLAAGTRRDGVLGGIGGFGALFELPGGRWRRPVLVSSTDGVGTKLKLAAVLGAHRGVGIDLVAMCANDVVTLGAEPLFFLDYYATGRLDEDAAAEVVAGIAEGCAQAGAALVGGETAEMPGMYAQGDYDLAGFCVGAVEHDAIVDGRRVAPDDVLIGMASSGPHANGYSLIRKVVETTGADLEAEVDGRPLREALLEPTRIYVPAVLALLAECDVGALAHVTGGGIAENLARVMPEGVSARVDPASWRRPEVFDWLQERGGVPEAEMLRTFNCGIGMIAVVPEPGMAPAVAALERAGERAWVIGRVDPGDAGSPRARVAG